MVNLPDGTTEKVSIIVTHWAMSKERSHVMWESMESLIKTAPNAEIIVVDNGGSFEDSLFFLQHAEEGHISCYVRNRKNMHFGFARNQGIKLCSGSYIVVADNDILYENDWLEECVMFLKNNQGKYFATPLPVDKAHWPSKYFNGEATRWKLNMRAGSNCWVSRKTDFDIVGPFLQHRVAGTKWTDRYVHLGYLMACMPQPKARDMGFRKGYNLNEEVKNLEL